MTDDFLPRLKAIIDKMGGNVPPSALAASPDPISKAQSDIADYFGEREKETATDVTQAVTDWFASRRGDE
jgi:hypothetical protein